jgi:hypothetical protein
LERFTVAYHGFREEKDVYHPSVYGVKIGELMKTYPEFDIDMAQLTPSRTFSNESYFQREPPRRLVEADDINVGAFFEVEGMSTGMITLWFRGRSVERPMCPAGHQKVPMTEWRHYNVNQIFGAANSELLDRLCGAPIVGVDSGDVAGFFHLAAVKFAFSAAMDDLVAEGWGVVWGAGLAGTWCHGQVMPMALSA